MDYMSMKLMSVVLPVCTAGCGGACPRGSAGVQNATVDESLERYDDIWETAATC